MKKTYKLENLDCANCAAKMEALIRKIDGVKSVTVNFMLQKMVLEAEDAIFESVVQQAAQAICKVDRHCKIAE